MSQYKFKLLSANASIPHADGVAGIRHSNGNRFLFGGVYNITTSDLYISNDAAPAQWQLHATLSVPPRHMACAAEMPDGRIYFRCGDHWNLASQKDLFSIDGNGNDLQIHETDLVPRIGGFMGCIGGFLYELGGQTTLAAPGPVTFHTDLRRWSSQTGYQGWQKNGTWGNDNEPAEMLFGTRGFYSGSCQKPGKFFLVGGTEYESGGYPRFNKHDLVTLEIAADGSPIVKLVEERLPGNGVSWGTVEYWDDNLWYMLGDDLTLGIGANGDLTKVRRSPDEGDSWIDEPDFPGTKRHAAASINGPDYVDILTGSHYGTDIYRLYKDPYTYGKQPNTTTGWGGVFSIVDLAPESAIPANTLISKVGFCFNNPHSGLITHIVRDRANGIYDVVYTGSAWNHPGGGYVDDPVPLAYQAPNDGYTYRIEVTASLPSAPAEAFSSIGSRAMVTGTISGNNVSMPTQSDGTICTRWV